jgi:NADH-quinone oxidoreductase subunit N
MPRIDLDAVLPLLIVGAGAALLPLVQVWLRRTERAGRTWLSRPVTPELAGTLLAVASALFLVAALLATLDDFGGPARPFHLDRPMIVMDAVSGFLHAVVLIGALLTVLLSTRYLARIGANHGEYYSLVMASVLGMMLLASATDLLMLFLALELMSIPVYALAAFHRDAVTSNESGLKYFIIGSFASAILLYGTALLYGSTGTLQLAEIGSRFDPESPLALLGTALLLVGLGFKIASVPFHQWAPDVYEGAPTTVTGLMATAVKVAGFGALLRVMALALQPSQEIVYSTLWGMSLLSMTVGNVMALIQQSMKRMLAYSSIAHAGYVLVGFCAGTSAAYSAVLFYLLVYTFMTIGAFAVVAALARGGAERERIDDLAGLHARRPFLAFVMLISMIALAGIPGTGGFMGKFQLFLAAIERGTASGDASLVWLAIAAVLNSAISLGYYLRVPIVMYMREPGGAAAPPAPGTLERAVLLTCAVATLLLGLFPGDVFLLADVDLLAATTTAAASLGL